MKKHRSPDYIKNKRLRIKNLNPNIKLLREVYDKAILGISWNFGEHPIVFYDMFKLCQIAESIFEIDNEEELYEEVNLWYDEIRTYDDDENYHGFVENPELNMSITEIKELLEISSECYELLNPEFDSFIIGMGHRVEEEDYFAVYDGDKLLDFFNQHRSKILDLKKKKSTKSPVFIFKL
ncbi:hypothetical protein DSAG12_02636 [Promethearchaeum syntrophicum]|uniref:Uncharacterized protein n=1 Tax=Promethearchaeum syntrophicum TaxID=2594042 RepID=A0A5B9DDL4_9ARCH|nr:hypothetical protein [Candidatus Prometheoarchaeum syntrophicum]QEE16806.1 hypothetical protein DSAG12_02636 [Candidatus Prometheoarchaeum syntrophicum]